MKTKVSLYWSLEVVCPYCNDDFDIAHQESDNKDLIGYVFGNQALTDYQTTCPCCTRSFTVDMTTIDYT